MLVASCLWRCEELHQEIFHMSNGIFPREIFFFFILSEKCNAIFINVRELQQAANMIDAVRVWHSLRYCELHFFLLSHCETCNEVTIFHLNSIQQMCVDGQLKNILGRAAHERTIKVPHRKFCDNLSTQQGTAKSNYFELVQGRARKILIKIQTYRFLLCCLSNDTMVSVAVLIAWFRNFLISAFFNFGVDVYLQGRERKTI